MLTPVGHCLLSAESDSISIGSARSNPLYDSFSSAGRGRGRGDLYADQISATESSREDNYRDFDTESDISSNADGETSFHPLLQIFELNL